MLETVQKIAFVVNKQKPKAPLLGEKLAFLAQGLGLQTKIITDYPLPDGCLEKQDLCCVLGGDGTLLSTVTQATLQGVPVLGVNQGKLGFLATFNPTQIEKLWPNILKGEVIIQPRNVLSCTNKAKKVFLGLNDVVIKSQSSTDLIRLNLSMQMPDLSWQNITEYACDGLLFSTATGSTAYNLSASGPIVHPFSPVMVMTPICPHTLSNRSLVFSLSTTLKVELLSSSKTLAHITVDGQTVMNSASSDIFPLIITIFQKNFSLVLPLDYNYFTIISNKLKWG